MKLPSLLATIARKENTSNQKEKLPVHYAQAGTTLIQLGLTIVYHALPEITWTTLVVLRAWSAMKGFPK